MKTDVAAIFRNKNVGTNGRVVSAALGSLLIYNAIKGRKKPLQAILGGFLVYRGATGNCPLRSALDNKMKTSPIEIDMALTVNKPLAETYRFWRNLGNLPLFMKHLKNVTEADERNSVWEAALPLHMGKLQWEAQITEERENELLSWRSIEGADIDNSGSVFFMDAGKFGTEIRVHIQYSAPAGKPGELAARLINPLLEGMIKEDIRNFRRYFETGEIPTTEGQPANN